MIPAEYLNGEQWGQRVGSFPSRSMLSQVWLLVGVFGGGSGQGRCPLPWALGYLRPQSSGAETALYISAEEEGGGEV